MDGIFVKALSPVFTICDTKQVFWKKRMDEGNSEFPCPVPSVGFHVRAVTAVCFKSFAVLSSWREEAETLSCGL